MQITRQSPLFLPARLAGAAPDIPSDTQNRLPTPSHTLRATAVDFRNRRCLQSNSSMRNWASDPLACLMSPSIASSGSRPMRWTGDMVAPYSGHPWACRVACVTQRHGGMMARFHRLEAGLLRSGTMRGSVGPQSDRERLSACRRRGDRDPTAGRATCSPCATCPGFCTLSDRSSPPAFGDVLSPPPRSAMPTASDLCAKRRHSGGPQTDRATATPRHETDAHAAIPRDGPRSRSDRPAERRDIPASSSLASGRVSRR